MNSRIVIILLLLGLNGFAQIKEAPVHKPRPSQTPAPAGPSASLMITWKGDNRVVVIVGGQEHDMAPGATKPVKVAANKSLEISVKVPGNKIYYPTEFLVAEPGGGFVDVDLQEYKRGSTIDYQVTFTYESQASRDEKRKEEEERIKREEEAERERKMQEEASAKEYSAYQDINYDYNSFKSDPYNDYSKLEALRKLCYEYLTRFETLGRSDYRYTEVKSKLEYLNSFPKSAVDFEAEKRRLAEKEAERKRQEEAEQKRLAEQRERERLAKEEAQRQAQIRAAEQEKARLKEERRKHNRSGTFLSYYTGTYAKYGLSMDLLEYKRIGLTMSFRSSLVFADTYYSSSSYIYIPTGKTKIGKTSYDIGITYPIFYPFAGYTSIGMGTLNIYQDYDVYEYNYNWYTGVGTLDYDSESLIKSELSQDLTFETSFGIITHWGRYIFTKTGFAYSNLGHREFTFGAGFNIRGKGN